MEMFRGEIPHVKHPKLDFAEFKQATQKTTTTMEEFAQLQRFALNKRAAEGMFECLEKQLNWFKILFLFFYSLLGSKGRRR